MRVSVVTGTYNSESFIARLYESLRSQSFKDFEWVLVDDFSNDKTLDVLLSLKPPGDHPIRIYKIPFNSGGPAANSLAILKASGDIVVRVDHDDELTHDALGQIVEDWDLFSKRHDFSGVIYKSVQPESGDKIEVAINRGAPFSWSKIMNSAKTSVDGLLVYDRDVIQRVTRLKDRPKICLNSVNLLRMSKGHRFLFGGNNVLQIYHRDNPDSQSNNIRITDRTIYTYSLLLGFFDRYYFLRMSRWVKHSAFLFKMCLSRGLNPFSVLVNIESWLGKVFYVVFGPLGIISFLGGRKLIFRDVVDFNIDDLEVIDELRLI